MTSSNEKDNAFVCGPECRQLPNDDSLNDNFVNNMDTNITTAVGNTNPNITTNNKISLSKTITPTLHHSVVPTAQHDIDDLSIASSAIQYQQLFLQNKNIRSFG
jgi:hypothetical protein